MKTYDELYDDIKCAVNKGFELGYFTEPYDVTDYKGYIADNGYLRGNTSVDLAVAVKANKQLNFSGRK